MPATPDQPLAHDDPAAFDDLPAMLSTLGAARQHLSAFMASYQFAIQEMETKVRILQQEFQLLHLYNPIEHITSRLKTPESVIAKARRRGCGPSTEELRREIRDIAGLRVVCSFTRDVYRVQEMLCRQADMELIELRDYIAEPKPSGYRSLHALVEIPVFLSDEVVRVPVEIQFRTIAQDFWASLEHKIFYKFDHSVPEDLTRELREAAATAAHLDAEMERLSEAVLEYAEPSAPDPLAVTEENVRDFVNLLTRRHDDTAPA